MSLLFCDGFDHYTVPTNGAIKKWDSATKTASGLYEVQPGDGRPSLSDTNTGGAKFLANNGGVPIVGNGYFIKSLAANIATGIIGFAFKIGSYGSMDVVVIAFQDGSTTQVDLRLDTSGALYFTRNGTVLGGSSVNVLATGVWYYIEAKVTIDPSAGVCILRVNGTSTGWVSLTGQNTRATANSFFGRIVVGQVGTSGTTGRIGPSPAFVDDLYVCDNSGSYNNDFLGDVRVNGQVPNGNGSLNQWTATFAAWPTSTAVALGTQILDSNGNVQEVTSKSGTGTTGGSAPTWNVTVGGTTTDNAGGNQVIWTNRGAAANWLAVSELPTPDSDFSYLSDATVGDQDRYTYAPLTGSQVFAVVGWPFAEKDDAGSRAIRVVAKSGATVGDNGSDLTMASNYSYQNGVLETDPATGVPWTVSGVNAAEFGVKVIS